MNDTPYLTPSAYAREALAVVMDQHDMAITPQTVLVKPGTGDLSWLTYQDDYCFVEGIYQGTASAGVITIGLVQSLRQNGEVQSINWTHYFGSENRFQGVDQTGRPVLLRPNSEATRHAFH